MFRDGAERVLVFRVGAERFAVPLAAVDEVIDAPPMQRLPDASPSQLGLAALREELVMVYDARPLLHVSDSDASSASVADVAGFAGALLLFERDGRRIGLAIDDVQDAVTIDADEVRPLPGADASDRTLIGVVRRDAELIAILDVRALLDSAVGAVTVGGERA